MDRAEQSKYYEMARKEKELHMQLYPGWSARDNYATHNKKKKRKRGSSEDSRSQGESPIKKKDKSETSSVCITATTPTSSLMVKHEPLYPIAQPMDLRLT